MLNGIGVSPGIVIGRVFKKKEENVIINMKTIEDAKLEIVRLNDAKAKCMEQIEGLYKNTVESMGEKEAQIFKAHIMILNDPEYFGKVEENIVNRKINAEHALKEVTDSYISMFKAIDNEYLRERAADLEDVSNRVLRVLQNVETEVFDDLDKRIIVARDLTPSDTANLDKDKIIGFITEAGGRTSHSSIIARTIGIPAVVGVEGILDSIKDGDYVILDGEQGIVYINPESEVISEYKLKIEEYEELQAKLKEMIGKETITLDGKKIELAANIGSYKDIESVLNNDAEGVGLFWTELTYMDRDTFPDEDEQFEIYKKIGEALDGKPIIIRTLDIGGDKEVSYLNLPKEENPFLGYRAIRICLNETEVFKTQLRAILRASMFGNLRIMFPMISGIKELREAKKILKEVMVQMKDEGIEFKENIQIGIMIEIPSAAITSDTLAKEVDFFSIGTNDLIQYTIAVDRMNKKISYLYDQYHPAVLKLIKLVIENGHKEGIWVGMCGEVAGNSKLIPALLGMGLDEFSMSPISILKSRWIIKNSNQKELKKVAEKVVDAESSDDVIEILEQI